MKAMCNIIIQNSVQIQHLVKALVNFALINCKVFVILKATLLIKKRRSEIFVAYDQCNTTVSRYFIKTSGTGSLIAIALKIFHEIVIQQNS